MKYREFCNKLDFTLIRTRGTKRRDLRDFFPAPVVYFRETIFLFLLLLKTVTFGNFYSKVN